jgi:protoheme IX farnesyltransferase
LALFRNDDYTRAGVPMMPVVAGEAETRRQILIYAVLLVPLGVLPAFIGMSSMLYGVVAAVLGLNFIRLSWALMRSPDDSSARRLFGFSIVYLFLLFLGLVIDRAIMPGQFLAGVL